MHVSGKGHLHNKRYGPYNFLVESKKIGHYQFLGHHFEIPSYSPLYLQSHVSQNVYPKILGKWHKNNTTEPNTQHHARFWQGTPPQQKIWPIFFLVESKKSDIINFWDIILKFQVAAPCAFRAMFLKTCILKFQGSGIKTIQQSPILNTCMFLARDTSTTKDMGHINF